MKSKSKLKVYVKPRIVSVGVNPMSSVGFPKSYSTEDALEKLKILAKRYPPQSKVVEVSFSIIGRVLADDVEAIEDIPAFRKSLVDGFAIIYNQSGTKRKIVGESTAEKPYDAMIQLGECVRITNGGVVPDGADTVVPFENVTLNDEEKCIQINVKHSRGEYIRERGSEAKEGQVLIKNGSKLGSLEVNLLCALGISQVEVYKNPRVCIMSALNAATNQKQTHEHSNRSRLLRIFQIQGFKPIDAGESSMKPKKMEKNLQIAADFACVIVIIGDINKIQKVIQKMNLKIYIDGIVPDNFVFGHGSIDRKPVFLCVLPQHLTPAWVGANVFIFPLMRTLGGQGFDSNYRLEGNLTTTVEESPRKLEFYSIRTELSNGVSKQESEANQRANSLLKTSENATYSSGDTVAIVLTDFT
ncbi:Protein CBR-LIN-46 [Caenorhabditis briggsae]|uniref:Protein CBR-LIN-46 n=1 Tax=Caenorhabditis briggsae TaxID=6238 RepID=A8X900_CAEBR|nr:Protein CBR-LIN-46 [Caenorhabditis briggsae]CAP29111.2 Protein CBR-LIN-46 [Caenorhabditis briggsae]